MHAHRLVAILFCCSSIICHGQDGFRFRAAGIGYFGVSVTDPGLKFSVDFYRAAGTAERFRYIVSPIVGFYCRPGNHTGIFVGAETSLRYYTSKRPYIEAVAGASYLRTFLDGPVYEVDDNGNVTEVPLPGNHQFMPAFEMGVGRRINKQESVLELWYFRLGGFLQYPHNSQWLPSVTLEAGVRLKTIRRW